MKEIFKILLIESHLLPPFNPLVFEALDSRVCTHVVHGRSLQLVLIGSNEVFVVGSLPVSQYYLARVFVRWHPISQLQSGAECVRSVRFERLLLVANVETRTHSESFMGSTGPLIFIGRYHGVSWRLLRQERNCISMPI